MRKVIRMNFETIMSFVGMIVIPVLGFLHRSNTKTSQDLADFKTEVARTYANKDEYVRLEGKIDNLVQLVMDRLPKKGK